MILLLSKSAWFCGTANLLSWVIINIQDLLYLFLYLQSPSGINYLFTYFAPLLYPYQNQSFKTKTFLHENWKFTGSKCIDQPFHDKLKHLSQEISMVQNVFCLAQLGRCWEGKFLKMCIVYCIHPWHFIVAFDKCHLT